VLDRFEILADDLNHPEGVAWDPLSGRLYAGGEGGEIYAVTLEGDVEEVASVDGSMLGLAVDGRGRVYACDAGNGEVVRFDPGSGDVITFARGPDGEELDTPNACAFDAAGTLYVSCSGEDDPDDATIVGVSRDGDVRVWGVATALYPNGVCMDADGSGLLVVESRLPGLTRIPILADGTAGEAETVAMLPDTEPDGVALDANGDAWVTRYRPDGLVRVTPEGDVIVEAHDPLAHVFDAPTNLAFCRDDLGLAVVANVGDTMLLAADLGVRGHALFYPELP
jgi:gluconolactonase